MDMIAENRIKELEFVARFISLQDKQINLLTDIYNGHYTPLTDEDDIFNNGEEVLEDLKDYINGHYDDEDPDCAALLHQVELMAGELVQIQSTSITASAS